MTIHPDFEELLELLEEHKVEYMIVGGFAVAFHGYPRFTKDIDIFYSGSEANVARLRRALLQFGFTDLDLPKELFLKKGNIITFGAEPSRVDIMAEIDGIEFGKAWEKKARGKYGAVEVNFIGRDELITNKSSTTRIEDKVDVEKLTGNF